MHEIADFRSDTVTRPTREMYDAMMSAALGDDVLGDEPTVQKLEELAAAKLGKEASLFCPSGTMTNQIAIHLHTRRGDELICEAGSHTYNNETGAMAGLSGVQVRLVPAVRGMPSVKDVLAAIQPDNDHKPRTALVILENTNNAASGAVLPQDQVLAVADAVKSRGLKFHLDGARLANAAVASGKTIKELAAPFETVSFCLSKGLGCPVGSVIAGSKAFVKEARRVRKMFGGSMRQAGILAACGIVALNKHIERLADDHALCKRLAAGLAEIKGVEVDAASVETNIIYFKVPGTEKKTEAIKRALADRKVLALFVNPITWRMVTHYDVDREDADRALKAWREVLASV